MTATPTREQVQGAFYSVMAALRGEAQNLKRTPEYLAQAETILDASRVARANIGVDRFVLMDIPGPGLAATFCAETDSQARLAQEEPSPELAVMRWEAIAAVLPSEHIEGEAGETEYAQAVEILYGREKARAVLASVKIQSAAELKLMQLPPPRWTVEGLLPEGLAMLSAPPKSGKSWLSLSLAVAVASGLRALGRLPVVSGRALFLGLEDSNRRLQSRLERLGDVFPADLDIITEIPPDVPVAALLGSWLSEHTDARLIVLDTLGRSLKGVDLMDYGEVTKALDPLQRLAFSHGVSVLLVNHTRKPGKNAGDVFDASLGSQGTFGAMDSAFVLYRKRGEDTAVLHVTGREIGDTSYSLELDRVSMQWRMTDQPPEETLQGPERRAILDILRKAGPEGARTSDIASSLGRAQSTVSTLLGKLKEKGLCTNPKYGKWKAIESIETVESAEPPKVSGILTFDTFHTFDDVLLPAKGETVSTANSETADLMGLWQKACISLQNPAVLRRLEGSPSNAGAVQGLFVRFFVVMDRAIHATHANIF